jgi:hypothetical protein
MIVSDLRQGGAFLRVLRFPPPGITEIFLKVALNTIFLTPILYQFLTQLLCLLFWSQHA